MKFLDYLSEDCIELNLKAHSPEEAVRELVALLVQAEKIDEMEKVVTAVMNREMSLSTGIGEGVALPHAKIELVQGPMMAIGISEEGIEWGAIDHRPAHLVILILSTQKDAGTQLRLLASISRLLKKKGVAPILLNTNSTKDLMEFFSEMEDKMIL